MTWQDQNTFREFWELKTFTDGMPTAFLPCSEAIFKKKNPMHTLHPRECLSLSSWLWPTLDKTILRKCWPILLWPTPILGSWLAQSGLLGPVKPTLVCRTPLRRTSPPLDPPKISLLFFPLPPPIFVFFLSLSLASSRGILVVCEAPEPTKSWCWPNFGFWPAKLDLAKLGAGLAKIRVSSLPKQK